MAQDKRKLVEVENREIVGSRKRARNGDEKLIVYR